MDVPGFVDLQVNGYKGIDFSSPELTEEGFVFACRELISQGTIIFLPTIITSSKDTYQRNLSLIAKAMRHDDLKEHIRGIHVEGPFISKLDGARGAHDRELIQEPNEKLLDDLYRWSGESIKLLTIAAEIEGADALCKHAVKLGITVSLGHQMATESDLLKLTKSGAQYLTHLGNGIPRIIDRHNNPIWAGLANDNLSAMIIPDGHHLPSSLIKSIIRAKGVSKVIVVSDAAPIAGLPPGKYNTLGNEVILEESGKLYNAETGYLVGSSSTMIDCLNYLLSLELLTANELFELGFYNPLRALKIDPEKVKRQFSPYLTMNDRFNVIKVES